MFECLAVSNDNEDPFLSNPQQVNAEHGYYRIQSKGVKDSTARALASASIPLPTIEAAAELIEVSYQDDANFHQYFYSLCGCSSLPCISVLASDSEENRKIVIECPG